MGGAIKLWPWPTPHTFPSRWGQTCSSAEWRRPLASARSAVSRIVSSCKPACVPCAACAPRLRYRGRMPRHAYAPCVYRCAQRCGVWECIYPLVGTISLDLAEVVCELCLCLPVQLVLDPNPLTVTVTMRACVLVCRAVPCIRASICVCMCAWSARLFSYDAVSAASRSRAAASLTRACSTDLPSCPHVYSHV